MLPSKPATAFQEFLICAEGGEAKICGTTVVDTHVHNGGSDWDIYCHDLRSGETLPICEEPGLQAHPAVSDGLIVWADHRGETWGVYGYDLHAATHLTICPSTSSAHNRIDVDVSGNTVVWTDLRNGNFDIYGYDLSSAQEFPICVAPNNQAMPRIDGDIVVWLDGRNADSFMDWDIYGYHLGTGTEFPVCTAEGGQGHSGGITGTSRLEISGNYVVWMDPRDSTGAMGVYPRSIYCYDIAEGREFCVAEDGIFPDISGDLIVWTQHSLPQALLGKYLGGVSFVVTESGVLPSVSGSIVVWLGYGGTHGAVIGPTQPSGPVFAPDAGGDRHYLTGQLHAHWMSDSPCVDLPDVRIGHDLDPRKLEQKYADVGYGFIAPTEHHPDPKWDDLAPGMFEDPGVPGIIHLGDSMEDSCGPDTYGPSLTGYSHILGAAFEWDWMDHSIVGTEDRAGRLSNIRSAGDGLAFIPHPDSLAYLWSDQTLMSEGIAGKYDGLEVFNATIAAFTHLRSQGHAIDTWTTLLQRGLHVRATAGDDFTPNIVFGFNRACVTAVVDLPEEEEPTADDVEAALRDGFFYVSCCDPEQYAERANDAPQIQGWWYDPIHQRARIQFRSPFGIDEVRFYSEISPDRGEVVWIAQVEALTDTWEASYSCTWPHRWVRAEVRDTVGRVSLTQPIWLNRWEGRAAEFPVATADYRAADARPLLLDLADAHLEVSSPQTNLTSVAGELVGVTEGPTASPPLGYVGYCYEFTPAVDLQGSNTLTIAYDPADVALCTETSLAVYQYDEELDAWLAIPSTVDIVAEQVTAAISSLGFFALSGDIEDDLVSPGITILQPGTGAISGEIEIQAETSDDNGVSRVRFFLDDLYIGSDTNGGDGWTCPLDCAIYANGAHSISVVARDAAGNEGEDSVEVVIGGGIVAPQIDLVFPTSDTVFWGNIEASGTWAGAEPMVGGMLYVDYMPAATITPTGAVWAAEEELLWDLNGTYLLTAEGRDAAGNLATDTVEVILRTFSDVPPQFWARDHIYSIARAGIVQGYPDGTYQPDSPVTRGQMAIYVSRALAGGDEYVPSGPAQPSFPDVASDGICYKYIEYARASEIVFGYPSDGLYHPEYEVDRGQMAIFIARATATPVGEPGMVGYTPPGTPTFPDVTPDPLDPYQACHKYVEYIAEQGVTHGYPDGLYHPEYIVSRGLMAIYVARAFQLPI